jgi:hypothetical protein
MGDVDLDVRYLCITTERRAGFLRELGTFLQTREDRETDSSAR